MQILDQPVFHLNGTVTDEQQQFFNIHGLIQFKNFVSKETVKTFIEEIENIQNYLLKRDIRTINGIPLKIGKDVDGSFLIQRMAFASQYSDILSRFINSNQVKALVTLLEPYEGRISENERRSCHKSFSQYGRWIIFSNGMAY